MYMKKHFTKAFTAILFAGILTAPSCSLWEEDTDPSEREGNGPGELIEYSCSLSPADFETKTVGVDDLPSYYIVGVYDITGTKVGVITSDGSFALYKYAKYSFYAVGGAVTDYTFPMSESDIADLPVWYSWSGDSPDAPSVGISADGAPVYGKVKGVTPASIASGTVLHIPVERKVAKFNLTVKTDSALRKYFNAPTISVQLCNANIGFFTESTTYTTNGEDAMSRYNSLVDDIYSGDGPTFTVASSSMSAAGSSPNLYYTWNSVFAVPENMNGSILAGNTDPSLKNKDSIEALDTTPSGVTYLDLAVTYSGSNGVAGTMHYRFYPGKDNTSNFDIEGGKIYNITCNLSYNGVFADAEWKIDTDSMSDARMIDLQCQSHNTAKGDTLWLKIGYSTGADYDYSSTPYGARKIGIFINNKADSETWTESNISSPYGTNPVSLPSFPMAQRRSATCLTCGNVFHGWPVRYTSSSANAFLNSWLSSHMGRISTGYLCPNCGTTLFNIASTTAMNTIRQAADGSTINSKIQFGYTTNYYAVPVPSAETKSSYLIDVVSYDGHHLAERTAPLGPVNQIPFRKTVDYLFYVAQKRTLTFYVGSLAASARTAVTFRATLTPDGGGSASDVSSWLSSNYDSSSSRWTVTVSAKSPGTVTVEALDSSLDVLGAHEMQVYKPALVNRSNVYLYASGEEVNVSAEYRHADGHVMSINASPVDQEYYFDEALAWNRLNCTCSTDMLYSSILSVQDKNAMVFTQSALRISGFNGSTMQTILSTPTKDVHIGTYTLTNTIGDSVTRDIYVRNFAAGGRETPIEIDDFGGFDFTTKETAVYAGPVSFRWYWAPNNGAAGSSATVSVIGSKDPDIYISYNATGTADVRNHVKATTGIVDQGIGRSYLFALITNSVSGETVQFKIRNIDSYLVAELDKDKVIIDDVGLLVDNEWRFRYPQGITNTSVKFNAVSYNVKIGIYMKNTSAPSIIRDMPSTDNLIQTYPDIIGDYAKESYPANSGSEAFSYVLYYTGARLDVTPSMSQSGLNYIKERIVWSR